MGPSLHAEVLKANESESQKILSTEPSLNQPLQSPKKNTKPEKAHSPKSSNAGQDEKHGTNERPFVIETVQSPNSASHTEKNSQNSNAHPPDDKTVERVSTAFNALAAVVVAIFTACLWWTAKKQWEATLMAATAAKESADVAVASSMPILSPLVVGGNLHPFSSVADQLYSSSATEPVTFESSVHVIFENFGKTPGIIRELRGDLFLCEMDEFPLIDFGQLPLINYQPIIAGDSRGEKALMGVAECVKRFTLTQAEFGELLASGDGKYRRFALIGRVVYDDFFENRHTRRFCVKLRLMDEPVRLFQLVRGGKTYNHVERQQIPNDDQF